jgi:hypothetical protein
MKIAGIGSERGGQSLASSVLVEFSRTSKLSTDSKAFLKVLQ